MGDLTRLSISPAPLLSAVNLGLSVVGFAVVITQLNQVSDQIRLIEAKVDRVSVKLDDLILAKLKPPHGQKHGRQLS